MRLKQISAWFIKLSFFFTLIVMGSCDSGKEFEQFQKIENQSWHRFNIIKFEFLVRKNLPSVDIILAIRHLPEFQVKELPVNVTLYSSSGEMRSSEHILKFTDKEGNSLSECLGDLCDITFILRKEFIFQNPGIARIEIENKWPRIELPGILELGLIIRQSSN